MASTQHRYNYTTLDKLSSGLQRVNVYGVVSFIVPLTFGGLLVEIKDETASAYVKISKDDDNIFHQLHVNDVIRLHRAQVGKYREEPAIFVKTGSRGCHAVVWSDSSDEPTLTTSENYTFSDEDRARCAALREWIKRGSRTATGGLLAPPKRSVNPTEVMVDKATEEANVLRQAEQTANQASTSVTTSQTVPCAKVIPEMASNFFNWYAQVLGVYKGKGRPFAVFVKAWDGTLPTFPRYRNMFVADFLSIEETICEAPPSATAVIHPYILHMCCYGEWASKAMTLKVGDVVHFCNIRNYMCKTKQVSALTMHEGGELFHRALDVVDENDPKHFEISRQCAEAFSKCAGSDKSLLEVFSDVTPITAERVVAQSTPRLSKEPEVVGASTAENVVAPSTSSLSKEPAVVGGSTAEMVVAQSTSSLSKEPAVPGREAQSAAVANNDNDSFFSVDEPPSKNPQGGEAPNEASPGPSREDAIDRRRVRGRKESLHEDIRKQLVAEDEPPTKSPQGGGSPSETPPGPSREETVDRRRVRGRKQDLPEDIRKQFTAEDEPPPNSPQGGEASSDAPPRPSKDEAVDRRRVRGKKESLPEDIRRQFTAEIRATLMQHKMKIALKKLKEPQPVAYDLAAEMHEILKLSVGQRVCFVNYVEAEVAVLDQPHYLRNAIWFTAVCEKCADEVIVERGSRNWCRKCFTDVQQQQLIPVRYNYRLLFPAVYRRQNGSYGELKLGIARAVWAAVPGSGDHLAAKSVEELYTEQDLRTFVRKLNYILLFTEAVMKRMRICDVEGRIKNLNKESGAITLFVDACKFRDKKDPKGEIVYV